MTEKYTLGDYEFDTYEAYLDGQDDLAKIDLITREMDVTDIYIALGLYERVRNKEIVFKTQVGTGFFMYLADVVVSGSKELLEEKKRAEERRRNAGIRSVAYRILGVVLIVSALGVGSYLWYDHYLEEQSALALSRVVGMQTMTGMQVAEQEYSENVVRDNTRELEALRAVLKERGITGTGGGDSSSETGGNSEGSLEADALIAETASRLSVLPEYVSLYAQNPDLAGWLSIEGTDINYPVMQSNEENGQYYLNRSFFGENDKNGSLFLDWRNDLIGGNTNMIIYGHNMRSGAMFGDLKNYLNDDYMNAHKFINFDTIYEKGVYEVIGAGLSQVSYDDEYTFRYYNFLNAADEDEMAAFRANMVQLLSTDRGEFDVTYGDRLLTLSTCNSYTEEGRMFVVAKRVE